jgi:putative ABC transport system permease protein
MTRYWFAALAASLARSRMLFALTVFGVALGIASVLSIQLINRGSMAAFRGAVQAVSAGADLSVLPRTAAIPESLYLAVRAVRGVRAAYPIYQVSAAVAGRTRFYLDVYGVDLFTPVEGLIAEPGAGSADPAAALSVPGWIAIAPALARELGVAPGDAITVSSGSRRVALTVGALVDFQRIAPLASRKLVLMDISQAQHYLGSRGELTQVDVMLEAGAGLADLTAALAAALGPAAEVLTAEQRDRRAEGLTAAFRLNLSALSLISLVVGFFLVHTATQASLVRRRAEFGILRANGATRAQVLGLIAADAALHGVCGVAVGLPLGWLAARANLDAVSATISSLYLLGEIERLEFPPHLALLAAALGIAAAFTGALGPALDLARTEVRGLLAPLTLHERTGSRAGARATLALGLLAATGTWYLALGREWRPAGFALAAALLLAVPLLVPWVVRAAAERARPAQFGLLYSLRSLAVRLQTTSFAVSSLAIAVAMMVGVTIMIGSFRSTVSEWIAATVRADLYITAQSWRGTGSAGTLDDSLVGALAAVPGVRSLDRLRGFQGYSGARRVSIAGLDMALPGGAARFRIRAGGPRAVSMVAGGGAVLISEPLARKARLGTRDSLPLHTAQGERHYAIAGIYQDYATESGGVVMDLATYESAFGPGPLNSVALYLDPGLDADSMVDEVLGAFAGAPLQVRSNRGLREEVLRIFEQTFAVTRLLQVMSLLVAATGITLTLLILAREREAELALYRALGAQRWQVFRYFAGKGIGIGAGGLLLGAACGLGFAAILVFVINRAWFGWTIQLAIPAGQLAFAATTILLVALLSSLYPALRASAASASDLARDDL